MRSDCTGWHIIYSQACLLTLYSALFASLSRHSRVSVTHLQTRLVVCFRDGTEVFSLGDIHAQEHYIFPLAVAVQREANQLVEEFMLLANMSIAALIAGAFPDRALLRRHPPPHQRKMEELAATAAGLVSHSLLMLSHEIRHASIMSVACQVDPRHGRQVAATAAGPVSHALLLLSHRCLLASLLIMSTLSLGRAHPRRHCP